MTKLAVVRIRGPVEVTRIVEDTLQMLKLKKVNHCRILEDNPSNRGMIKKAKEYITWGVLNDETEKELEKKAKAQNSKLETKHDLVRLHPPIKGFERKGIKMPYSQGGVLGDRKEKINELIKKML